MVSSDGAGSEGLGRDLPQVSRRKAQTLGNHTRSSFSRISTECNLWKGKRPQTFSGMDFG
jgi:hypothetical protein